jgi:hypothetical protein
MTKKQLLIITVVVTNILLPVNLCAQTNKPWIKNRWNIKAGFSKYKSGSIYKTSGSTVTDELYDVYQLDGRLEASYGFLNCMEAGVYGGVFIEEKNIGAGISSGFYLMPAYGFNVNFHPLPLLMPKKSLWFDLYLTGKAGGKTFKGSYGWDSGVRSEYGLGTGASLYIFGIGIYAEYLLGKYSPEWIWGKQKTSLRYGITFRF